MMSLEYIESESRAAAKKAAKSNKRPYIVEAEDIVSWKTRRQQLPFPNLGSFVPKGWKEVDSLFCDSSGFGAPGEPALTYAQLIAKLEVGKGYAITQVGQFQVYVGVFERIDN